MLFCSGLVAASLSIGYHLGVWYTTLPARSPEVGSIDLQELETEVDSEDDDEQLSDGNLSAVKAGLMEPCKMVCYAWLV